MTDETSHDEIIQFIKQENKQDISLYDLYEKYTKCTIEEHLPSKCNDRGGIWIESLKSLEIPRPCFKKINRPTKPEEVANLVYKLIKDKNSNFKNLSIDGGKIKNLR